MTDLDTFIAGLPKAELHVHHVGSATPEAVAILAQRHPDTVVPQTAEEVADFFTFTDFAHFIDVYLAVSALVQNADDVHTLTYEVARGLRDQNVRYAELTCTPYNSTQHGIAGEDYCAAIEQARSDAARDLGIELRWIFDIPGESGMPAADETIRCAVDIAPDGLIGFGLGGPEIGVPRPQFKPYFDRARAAGLHSVPHAGESTGPQTVWDAIHELGAERIGHGCSAVDDPALLAYLAEHQVPLEVSPTSNIATRVVERYEDHPLPRFVEAGVPVSINSDDPPMFGTTLGREYAVAAELLGLDEAGVADLARAAVRQSYAPDHVKRDLDTAITHHLGR